MSEPTARITACCHHDTTYCFRCDLLVGLGELHVTAVEFDHDVGLLTVGVESRRVPVGCTSCGVIAHSHGRRVVVLVDAPCFERPVKLVWHKRTWLTCPIPEIKRLGKTLKQWREAFVAYFDTGRASNGGTEAMVKSGGVV